MKLLLVIAICFLLIGCSHLSHIGGKVLDNMKPKDHNINIVNHARVPVKSLKKTKKIKNKKVKKTKSCTTKEI